MITDWDIGSFTKIGSKFYDYLHIDNIYYGVEEIKDALKFINKLKSKGHRIIFVTAYDYNNFKLKWLKEHKFLDDDNDYVVAHDKTLVKGDILVDDNYDNVKQYSEKNHKPTILYSRPWNKKFNYFERAMDWSEVLWWIEKFEVKNF